MDMLDTCLDGSGSRVVEIIISRQQRQSRSVRDIQEGQLWQTRFAFGFIFGNCCIDRMILHQLQWSLWGWPRSSWTRLVGGWRIAAGAGGGALLRFPEYGNRSMPRRMGVPCVGWSQLCSSCWYFDRLKFIKIERVEVHGHPFQESQLGEISTLRQHGTTMNKTGMPFAYMCSLCSRGLDLGKLPVHPSLTISYHYHGCSTHICILHYFQCMQ